MARAPRALLPLRHGPFRLLVGGQLTSGVGDAFYAVALPWYVLAAHKGPLLLGSVLAAYGIARTVVLAVGGQASDRWGPWSVMMVADVFRAMAVAALAAAAAIGPPHAYLLVPISAVLGAGQGLFLPGSLTIVPSLLPGEELEAGNAITEGGAQLASLIGPGVGGAVVAITGVTPAFATDAVSFAISAATLWGIRARRSVRRAGPERVNVTEQVPVETDTRAEQLPVETDTRAEPPPTLRRLIANERVVQIVIVVLVAANLGAGGASEVALPALARGPLGAGAGGYGGLLAAFAGGALVGVLAAGQARRARRPAMVASLGFLIEAGCLAAVPYLGGLIPAIVALAAFGALNGFGNLIMLTAFQRWAPPALLGRLMGLLMFAAMGVFPISVFVAGILVQHIGPAPFFPVAGALLAAAILLSLTQPSWRSFGSAAEATNPVPEVPAAP